MTNKTNGAGSLERIGKNTIAPLKNVALCIKAMDNAYERMAQREDGEPGMICFYGPAGFGKTQAATKVAIDYKACYVRIQDSWTRKDTLIAMAHALGLPPETTTSRLAGQVGGHLAQTEIPLVIDEMDYLVKRNAVEFVRDLYDVAHVPVMLIGEERLPDALKATERFHRRVFDWIPAQKADASDAKVLVRFYSRRVAIADDLLGETARRAKGSLSRITVNLSRIEKESLEAGKAEMDLAAWTALGKGFWSGEGVVRGEFAR
jgi:DNA transposition AAA+ family ATPase